VGYWVMDSPDEPRKFIKEKEERELPSGGVAKQTKKRIWDSLPRFFYGMK
jgi:hypothetical protein